MDYLVVWIIFSVVILFTFLSLIVLITLIIDETFTLNLESRTDRRFFF